MGLVFTYNNRVNTNTPNLPMPSANANANATYFAMNRRINSTNSTPMRSLIRIPPGGGSSCSPCGH